MTEARKPGLRGEHEISRNTIAQGRPDCFWRTCGDLSSCPFSFGREAAGAQSIRLSLRPLFFRGTNGLWITRALVPRERGGLSSVIARAKATKQSSPPVIPGWCVSTRPGISRFRARLFEAPRNDAEKIWIAGARNDGVRIPRMRGA